MEVGKVLSLCSCYPVLMTFVLEVILSDEKRENEWLLQAPGLFL